MATEITNQARLTFTYGQSTGSVSSNIASTMMQGPLSGEKNTLDRSYRGAEELTYLITATNTGASSLSGVTVRDDLGRYALASTRIVTPLTYTGPAQLYINGIYNSSLTPDATTEGITFTIPNLAAGASAMIIYQAMVNEYAPLSTGSAIENTVTIGAAGLSEAVTATATVPVEDYADLRITKVMTPNPVTDGATLTNTFTINNYGNTPATNVVLSDAFFLAPNPITVTVDGATVDPQDYTYVDGTLTLPAAASSYSLTIPAADIVQNATTGEVTVNPGVVTIVVAGLL